jgi:hypothetical protein
VEEDKPEPIQKETSSPDVIIFADVIIENNLI